jgi:hypothetical protein
MLDIFRSDAFQVTTLTDLINHAPYAPGRLGPLFRSRGIRTTTVTIEEKTGILRLIQTSPRGGVPSSEGKVKRTARSFPVTHLERESNITADEVQNVREFGSEDGTRAVQSLVDEQMAMLRQAHEVTLERHRMGALQGIILDADGSTLIDLFTAFGVSQNTGVLAIDDASDAGDNLRRQIRGLQREVEDELGADRAMVTGYRAFCGPDFIDNLRSDVGVVQTLRYADPNALRENQAEGVAFNFGGVAWEEYRASVEDEDGNSQDFVADDEAYLVPVGPDLLRTYFAPADMMKAVNTLGLPVYAMLLPDPSGADRFVKVHTQSNPLCLNLRPRAVIKLTITT